MEGINIIIEKIVRQIVAIDSKCEALDHILGIEACSKCPIRTCTFFDSGLDFESLTVEQILSIVEDWLKIKNKEFDEVIDNAELTVGQLIDNLELADEDRIEIITTLINDYDLPPIGGTCAHFFDSKLKVVDHIQRDGKLIIWIKE